MFCAYNKCLLFKSIDLQLQRCEIPHRLYFRQYYDGAGVIPLQDFRTYSKLWHMVQLPTSLNINILQFYIQYPRIFTVFTPTISLLIVQEYIFLYILHYIDVTSVVVGISDFPPIHRDFCKKKKPPYERVNILYLYSILSS